MRKSPNKTDAAVFMRTHYPSHARAAMNVYARANAARRTAKPAQSLEGNQPVKTLRADPLPKAPKLFNYPEPSDHLVSQFKAFKSGEQALDCLYSYLAGWGRYYGQPNRKAEAWEKDRGLTPMAIATEAAPTAGGYLVPTPIAKSIIETRGRVGVDRQLATVIPMDSEMLTAPVEDSGLSVYYTNEAIALTVSDFTFAELGLRVEKRTVFTKVSNELSADALIVWLDRFIARAAYALANTEDDEFVNADGTSDFGGEVGLLSSLGAGGISTAATGHDTWPEIDVDDFTACMAKLPSDFATGGEAWLCSPQFYAVGMLTAVGGNSQGFDENGRPLFLGKPVFLTPKMPTSTAAATVCCLYGSFSEAVAIGDRGISFASSDKAPGAFEADLTIFRAVSRYDINVFNAGDATNAGAYVGLKTAS